MEMVCVQWGLEGYHRASYELHAKKLRKIANKLQTGLGYDYDAAVRRCHRQKGKRSTDSIGEDALTLASQKNQKGTGSHGT